MWPIWATLALLGYAIDLGSKLAAVAYLDPNVPVPLLGNLVSLRLIRNPGAAFSLGADFTVVLSVFAIAAFIAVLAYAIMRVTKLSHAVVAGLLLAGIAGNLTDRLFRAPGVLQGHVVDMFQVPYWAIFNVADIWITSAALLMVIISVKGDS